VAQLGIRTPGSGGNLPRRYWKISPVSMMLFTGKRRTVVNNGLDWSLMEAVMSQYTCSAWQTG
jgi:hypothetical protein